MGLVQAAKHLAQNIARSVHAVGSFDLWAELVVNRLPVQTAGLSLPVLVADGGPDVLERLNIELALLWRERGSERISDRGSGRSRRENRRDRADHSTANHSFSRTLAPSAPPIMGSAVNKTNNNTQIEHHHSGAHGRIAQMLRITCPRERRSAGSWLANLFYESPSF